MSLKSDVYVRYLEFCFKLSNEGDANHIYASETSIKIFKWTSYFTLNQLNWSGDSTNKTSINPQPLSLLIS